MDNDPNYFWLITLAESNVNVSLVAIGQSVVIQATSRDLPWTDANNELITAINNGIDFCDQQLNLNENQEPDRAAFIISPFWVAGDGKIIDHKLQLIQNTCKQLSLKPMGFMPYDEAIIEEANKQEGIPASFVLAYIDGNQLIVSLTFLGKIKRRIRKIFTGTFDPVLLESSILEMNVESALPPLINLCGQVDESIGHEVRNFPWIGKKSVETFLHFPEVKVIGREELIRLYARIIARQINPNLLLTTPVAKLPIPVENETIKEPSSIEELPLDDFGFMPVNSTEALPKVAESEIIPDPVLSSVPLPPKTHFKFPKINITLPRFLFWFYIFIGIIFIGSILLHLLAKTKIDLYVTPYNFSQKITTTAATDSSKAFSLTNIPVDRKTVTLSVTDSIDTTGKKVIGDKSKGEIVIYNKNEKTILITKGSQLTYNNLKYEVQNDTQVASSSSDLEKGVITLGQTRTMVTALDIGPEYNIAKDSRLEFIDNAFSSLLAKANGTFAGGTRQEINAVSLTDKNQLEAKLSQKISDLIDNKSNSELSGLLTLKGTTVIKKNNLDLSREIGEQADKLEGSQEAFISVFVLTPEVQSQIINKMALLDPKYNEVDEAAGQFTLEFVASSVDDTSAKGVLTLSGSAPPKIDSVSLVSRITTKSSSQARTIIKKYVPRAYDLKIETTNYSPLRFIDLLPFTSKNIKIIIHSNPQ